MSLGKFAVTMCLLTAPMWAQFSRADMMKLATDRFDTATQTLKLSPDQVAAVKPLLQSKYIELGQVKDVYRAGVKNDAKKSDAKKDAKELLKAIDAKYNTKINTILSPEQAKTWKRLQKDWKDDLVVPKS